MMWIPPVKALDWRSSFSSKEIIHRGTSSPRRTDKNTQPAGNYITKIKPLTWWKWVPCMHGWFVGAMECERTENRANKNTKLQLVFWDQGAAMRAALFPVNVFINVDWMWINFLNRVCLDWGKLKKNVNIIFASPSCPVQLIPLRIGKGRYWGYIWPIGDH